MFIINIFSTCSGHHYAHLLDVVGSGCGALRWNVATHNRYQPHPAEPS